MENMGRLICVLGAMVGAGFASGREIVQFFSTYGVFSWGLVCLCAVLMGFLIYAVLGAGSVSALLGKGKAARLGEGLLFTLMLVSAGAMAAAAGEVTALTVPQRHARSLGLFLTLGAGCFLAHGRSLKGLERLGWALIPALLMAWGWCLKKPPEHGAAAGLSLLRAVRGLGGIGCYAALNVTLAAGVLCEIGQGRKQTERKRIALGAGAMIGAMLCLGNAVMGRHSRAVEGQPLPTVILLRDDGKAGYYLSAAVLYLAIFTTLIAVLRGMMAVLSPRFPRMSVPCTYLGTAAVAICGFERVVEVGYPLMGALCLILLVRFCWAQKKRTRHFPAGCALRKNHSSWNNS